MVVSVADNQATMVQGHTQAWPEENVNYKADTVVVSMAVEGVEVDTAFG
jgi:hypothetical protein